MTAIDQTVARVEGELGRYSLALAVEFRKAVEMAQSHLTSEQIEAWSVEGLAIARNSFRSWEAALEYYKASPAVARKLDFPLVMDWAALGRALSDQSAVIAASFFSSSPDALAFISPADIPGWVELGRRLHQDNWKSSLLCGQFFAASTVLLRYLSLTELDRFVGYLESLARLSLDSAIECLSIAPSTFAQVERRDVEDYISLAMSIGERNWRVAKAYLGNGPGSLALVGPQDRSLFFALAKEAAQSSCEEALVFFTECPQHLCAVDRGLQGEVLRLAARVLKLSPPAARELIRNCHSLLKRLALRELCEWVDIGVSVLEESREAGIAFFKLNSNRASLALHAVSRAAELTEVRDVLRIYGKGLTGKNVALQSSQELVDKGIGWTSSDKPTTEGSTIFLPPHLDAFETKAQNLEAYKVLTTHQAAHLEFGTFDFSYERPASLFDNRRHEIEEALATDRQPIADFERFFDIFKDRRLARDVFTALEDARIDARVRHEYRGIRRGYSRAQQHALEKRPKVSSVPVRQGILEFLIQTSLDPATPLAVPFLFADRFAAAAIISRRLQNPIASVEDTSEATLRVYTIVRGLPNLLPFDEELLELRPEELGEGIDLLSALEFVYTDAMAELEGAGEMYVSPESVDYRGELKPELVQTMMKLRQDGREHGKMDGFPIPPELLRELLAKSLDIELIDMVQGDIDESSGMFISNLIKEYGRMKGAESAKKTARKKARKDGVEDYEEMVEDDGSISYYYDEWDFRATDYRPNWCRLKEKVMQEGAVDFFDSTLREYAGLANEVKRQFEMLRPEQFKKLKRLHDGEEFEIDHIVEHVVEKKAGQSPTDKVYWRKNKVERDIAVVVLLDMSASTDEEIKEPEGGNTDWWDDSWLFHRRFGQPWVVPLPTRERGKRIIDVEKESIVLLIRALEAIGDRYGIYGFSGYGRDNVEFFVVKSLSEEFGDDIKRRIDKITPVRGTRMGPAIRHCISKLENVDARLRLLILLSDGRPQDHDYGKDRTEKEYAIHDTRMALLEAKRKNIVPFCLTVDKAGQDYLKTMMGDLGYEVVNDIESLPKRLPSLYKRLTT